MDVGEVLRSPWKRVRANRQVLLVVVCEGLVPVVWWCWLLWTIKRKQRTALHHKLLEFLCPALQCSACKDARCLHREIG